MLETIVHCRSGHHARRLNPTTTHGSTAPRLIGFKCHTHLCPFPFHLAFPLVNLRPTLGMYAALHICTAWRSCTPGLEAGKRTSHSRSTLPQSTVMFCEALGIVGTPGEYFSTPIIWTATTVLVTYVTWYIWTFKLRLIWRPSEPKPLPYLIPCKYILTCIRIMLIEYSHW